jgi:DNA invertase Pin-like site-specific DNA recombinase
MGQTLENQKRELKAAAKRHSWTIVAAFSDHGVSRTKTPNKRPGFDALCKAISRREFEMVAAWSVDRLGRSLQDLVGFQRSYRTCVVSGLPLGMTKLVSDL